MTSSHTGPSAQCSAMEITITIEDAYSNGETFSRTETVTVEEPASASDLDDWAADTLFEFTGQGEEYSSLDSIHDITVAQCADRPDLVGHTFSIG